MAEPSRHRSWPVLAVGFGLLFGVMGFLSFSGLKSVRRVYTEVASIHVAYRESASALSHIQSAIYRSAIVVRDHLLDPSAVSRERCRAELLQIKASIAKDLQAVESLPEPGEPGAVAELRRDLDEYWQALSPALSLTPQTRPELTPEFLMREVVPRRLAVISMTNRISSLSAAGLRRAEERTALSRWEYLQALRRTLAVAFLLAVLVAVFSLVRTYELERRSETERERAEKAEEELRSLSQKLVRAQEAERKSISRELHDEIGQRLTALRIEIGRLEKIRSGPETDFHSRVAEAKALAEGVLRSVRDLAMGLRPSMLDDLGLGPALDWQAREFFRHAGVQARVDVEGDLTGLPESVRTCAYRVVQEALTNCARHAGAQDVRVTVRADESRVQLEIVDDGVGFDAIHPPGAGLGLIGIGERVRELGGTVSLYSRPGRGTSWKVEIPVHPEGET